MLEGSTTSKTTLRTSLVLIWFDDSPYSNQSLVKMIGPLIDHEDQSMKKSSFYNTQHKISLWKWTKLDKFLSSNSPSCCLAWPTSSGVSNTDSWRRGGLLGTQLVHKLNISVRGQPGGTSKKIFGKSRSTDMLVRSRSILLFGARRYDRISKDWHYPNSLIEKCTGNKDWVARSTLGCDSVTNTLRMKLLSFNYQATGLLGVLISHIIVHLSTFRLQQHGDREMNNDGEEYHCTKNS